MIELTQGRSVRWQHNGQWFTGFVLENEAGGVLIPMADVGLVAMVRHSNTCKVFAVPIGVLQDNDFRPLETEMLRLIDVLKKAYDRVEDDAKQFVPYEGAKELLANYLNGKATAEEVQEFIEECKAEMAESEAGK